MVQAAYTSFGHPSHKVLDFKQVKGRGGQDGDYQEIGSRRHCSGPQGCLALSDCSVFLPSQITGTPPALVLGLL